MKSCFKKVSFICFPTSGMSRRKLQTSRSNHRLNFTLSLWNPLCTWVMPRSASASGKLQLAPVYLEKHKLIKTPMSMSLTSSSGLEFHSICTFYPKKCPTGGGNQLPWRMLRSGCDAEIDVLLSVWTSSCPWVPSAYFPFLQLTVGLPYLPPVYMAGGWKEAEKLARG